ncbi:MAG: glycosyltransferase involved in cell wall biosynthesis [Glaciecola sp.]|jgi:glycosyltransferase involved in cell wall biosynthesis
MTQQKKNILHITYDMRIGGTEMVIKNIIEGCDNAFSMSIFCIEEPLGPWGQDLQKTGIKVSTFARADGFDTSLISALRKHIKKYNINIVHCHQYTPWVYGTLAVFGLSTKVIFTEHGRFYPDSSGWKRRIVNPLLAMMTHKLTTISNATRQALVNYEFLKTDKIDVIYNGIKGLEFDENAALDIRNKLKIQASDIVFGTIARLDPIKNHNMMLRAFADVTKKNPRTKLIIVGDGELMPTLKSLIQALDIEDRVMLTGYIPYPKDYLGIFDIFLLSSLSEGTSMTLLEAMSLAKPCIVTDAGGNKEIVTHGETGLVTDNDNMLQFSDAMLALANDKDTTQKYGKNARVVFEQKFDASHMAEEYANIYAS